ncbi:hypothetical protein KCP78_01180 [Salmonella enterica subsp. enterica]|nr:hypothetical protein KCP78_01180 [Salmonella enterica subsp. enterica]
MTRETFRDPRHRCDPINCQLRFAAARTAASVKSIGFCASCESLWELLLSGAALYNRLNGGGNPCFLQPTLWPRYVTATAARASTDTRWGNVDTRLSGLKPLLVECRRKPADAPALTPHPRPDVCSGCRRRLARHPSSIAG